MYSGTYTIRKDPIAEKAVTLTLDSVTTRTIHIKG